MEEAVLDVLPQYDGQVDCRRIDLFTEPGKNRFLELSCDLFGQSGVYKYHRLAPVPGLFIDGELVFDAIPSRDELELAIEACLRRGEAATGANRSYRTPACSDGGSGRTV